MKKKLADMQAASSNCSLRLPSTPSLLADLSLEKNTCNRLHSLHTSWRTDKLPFPATKTKSTPSEQGPIEQLETNANTCKQSKRCTTSSNPKTQYSEEQ
jgi:hypothetical protein